MSTTEYPKLMTTEQIHANCANAYYLNKYGINPRPDKTVNDYYRNKYGDEEDSYAEDELIFKSCRTGF